MGQLRVGNLNQLNGLPPGGAGPFTGAMAVPLPAGGRQGAVQSVQARRDLPEAAAGRSPDLAARQALAGQQLPVITGSAPTANTPHHLMELKGQSNGMPTNLDDQRYRQAVNERTMPAAHPVQTMRGDQVPLADRDAVNFYAGAINTLIGPEGQRLREVAQQRLSRRA